MKILFCLLLILVNSQEEFPEEIQNIIRDSEKCLEGDENIENKEICYSLSNQLSNKYYQCCILTMKSKEETKTNCSFVGGPIEIIKKIQTEGAKALQKELFGYFIYGFPSNEQDSPNQRIEDNKLLQSYECKDGNFEVYYGYDTYTNEDQRILKSEKHCLYHFYGYTIRPYSFMDNLPTQEDCFKAEMLQSSKDSGLKCSYFNFTFKDFNGNPKPFSTCYFYSLDSTSFDTRSTGAFTMLCQNIVRGYGTCQDYSLDIIDEYGNIFRYNSSTGQIEKDTPDTKKKKKSYSKTLIISKFLFLIFLFFI